MNDSDGEGVPWRLVIFFSTISGDDAEETADKLLSSRLILKTLRTESRKAIFSHIQKFTSRYYIPIP